MASFTFKTFTENLQTLIDTMTANTTQLLNFGEGSVVRVLFEAVCGRLDYVTIQLRKILLLARLQSSTGADVDSFIADYGMDARLQAVAASGNVTVSRKVASSNAVLIPIGSTFITYDDSVTFQVIIDTTNPAYNASQNGYILPANQLTVTVAVRAVTPGSSGNIGANTLTIIGSTLPGVDNVTNPSAFTNGKDAETDAQVKARFIKFIQTRARATKLALSYALDIVQSNLTYIIKENIDINNNPQLGHVVIVVDDGSGSPPSGLLNALRASVDLYRGFSITVDLYGPSVLTTTASVTVGVDPSYTSSVVKANVATAITNLLNTQQFGQFLSPEKIAFVAFGVPGVIDVNNAQLNGSTADIQPLFNQLVKAGTVTVS